MRVIEGQLLAEGLKIAIVAARFNSFMSEQLVDAAINTIVRHGGQKDSITLVRVPGSFELPITCKKLSESGNYNAVVALGVVIRGDTYHYELVCDQAASGIAKVSTETNVPIAFGLVTADTIEQAIERCGSKAGNKGADAALVAIEMANLLREIK
jgi:6,7-dimethyl-8-ribityllumazine synthase